MTSGLRVNSHVLQNGGHVWQQAKPSRNSQKEDAELSVALPLRASRDLVLGITFYPVPATDYRTKFPEVPLLLLASLLTDLNEQ